MAKDFYKSNYGINKHSKGIVYKYADYRPIEPCTLSAKTYMK